MPTTAVRAATPTGRARRLAGAVAVAGLGTGLLAGCGGTTGASAEDGLGAYAGQRVTVSAEVEEVLTPLVFTIAGTGGLGGSDELLVVAGRAGAAVTEEDTVRVTGTVREPFELYAVEQEYGVDYPDEEFDEYEADPYLVAEAVDPTVPAAGGTTIDPAP